MSAPTVSPDSNFKERPESEKILDKGFVGLTTAFAIAIGVILLLIALVIFIRALPAIQTFGLGFLTSSAWNPVRGREEFGVLPVIYGTLVSSLIALLIAVPLGIGSAIFLSEDFIPLNARTILVFLVQLLAAIPSVVYGLWGIFVLIPILRPLGNWLNANFS
ncbi:MAG: phosphate ABC transporter permease subunit PstC, partial [Microcystis sp. M49629_WE12]|nr:phosphate ABC transporter permease subunit PstC [Microcystis sp. M49629_WE12]